MFQFPPDNSLIPVSGAGDRLDQTRDRGAEGTRAIWRHEMKFTTSPMRLKVSRQFDGIKPTIADDCSVIGLPFQQGLRQLDCIHLDPDRALAYHDPPHYVPDEFMLDRDSKLGPALGQIQGAVRRHLLLWTAFEANGALVGGRE